MRRIGWGAVLSIVGAAAYGQAPVPVADPVETQLLPSGISALPVDLNGALAYVFQDADETDALHYIGDFLLTVGEGEGQELSSRQAVVWITNHRQGTRAYRHLDILLWRDAEIREVGDTRTSGPALFVTLNTSGPVRAHMDDIAYESSADSEPYRVGNVIRSAVANGRLSGTHKPVVHRIPDLGSPPEQPEARKPRSVIHVRSEGELTLTEAEGGQRLLTVVGGVYLSRGEPGKNDFLEIRAGSLVVFLPEASPAAGRNKPAGMGGEAREPTSPPGKERQPSRQPAGGEVGERQLLSAGFGEIEVEGAYLEGDVVMTQGPNMIRASKLYYDFLEDRAVILDAVVRATLVKRNLPLFLRAAEIRQLSRTHFTAADAILTTSEFHTPHYHVGARRVDLSGLTAADPATRVRGIRAGRFDIRHATLNLGGRPVFYWPHVSGNIDTSETAIQSVRTGFSDTFGLEFETDWDLFNVLGLQTPKGFKGTLSLDYFSERGPAIGADVAYERDTYTGLLRSYLLSDRDQDFLGRDRERGVRQDVRGRFLLRHRQYLEDNWELTLELSAISDRGFLEEFFEDEFDNDKEQETLLYLKKQRDNWAFTALLQSRILDFTTQTERLPDFAFHLEGEPLGARATWYGENRLGAVRFRRADRPLRPIRQRLRELLREGRLVGSSGSVGRLDTRQEVGVPLDVGPWRLVPFVSLRGTAWDDSPEGGLARVFGTYGVRGSLYLSRVYPEVRSALFDLEGVRHVIKPDVVVWASHTNRDSHELFPFDETVEEIDEIDGVALGLRQRWQTKRGKQENRRTVDFVTWDTELGLFHDAERDEITNGFISFSRPENSISQNYFNSSVIWRANDRTALVSELNYDLNDGEVDVLNVSLAVERSPRLSYLLGYRFIEEEDSNLLGFDMDYRMTEKHSLALRELFDLARGQTLDFTIALIRRFPRWYGAVSFALDESEDDFGVSFSLWPEGLPQAALGSRRFTGITQLSRPRRD